MKKIIVPVDFSKHSEYALKVAADIAKKHNAELLLIHMLDISDQMISITEATQRRELMFFMQLATKRFEDFMAQDFLEGVKVTPIIKHHKVFEEINNAADEVQADLIIMGSRGATGIKGFFVGSNTEKVVRTASIPVLVVKTKINSFNPQTIVFASDFDEENLNAFKKVKTFAQNFKSNIKLVYVNTPNAKFRSTNEIREQMRLFLNSATISNASSDLIIYNDYTIEDGIRNAAYNNAADMIAIPTHGRTGLYKVLAGSVSEDVANKMDLPVLTVRL